MLVVDGVLIITYNILHLSCEVGRPSSMYTLTTIGSYLSIVDHVHMPK